MSGMRTFSCLSWTFLDWFRLSLLVIFRVDGQNGEFRHADAVVAAGLAQGRKAKEPRGDGREADFLRDGVVSDVPEAALFDVGRPVLSVAARLEAVAVDRAADPLRGYPASRRSAA